MRDNVRDALGRVSRMNGAATASAADVLLTADPVTIMMAADVIGSGRTVDDRAAALCAILARYGVGTIVAGVIGA